MKRIKTSSSTWSSERSSKRVLFHLSPSQEIADGVNKSAQAVQAAEAGVRQIGSLARQQTMGEMLVYSSS